MLFIFCFFDINIILKYLYNMFPLISTNNYAKIFGIIASVSFLLGLYQPKLSFW